MKLRELTLEDRGQDFTRFLVDESGQILDAQPFQAWLWTQYSIVTETMVEGQAEVPSAEDAQGIPK